MKDYRKIISDKLFKVIGDINGILSVTIVGSLCDHSDVSAISDIDTIVICRKLTQEIYEKCVNAIMRLSGNELGFPDRFVYVNPTFGPLKFDTHNLVVVHLMIYDVEGHRRHVLKSPFTCYDWERSKLHIGLSLKEIYPVSKLQPRDFLQARRGLQNYLEDISQGVVSYRNYHFEGRKVQEVLAYKHLDCRHQGEYAFHIVKNLVANYIKLLMQDNNLLSNEKLFENWQRFLPWCSYFIPFFEKLSEIKMQRGLNFPSDTVAKVKDFVLQFEEQFRKFLDGCSCLQFLRHAPTNLNDGSFLGQGRDPAIVEDMKVCSLENSVERVFCSPLRRSVQTARRCVAPNVPITEDGRLLEIQYGKAEGLTYAELRESFPDVVVGWENGEDPAFPDGENVRAVYKRLKSFLREHKNNWGSSLVVTHNVVLRCLAGHLYGIPLKEWYKLAVPHLKPMEVLEIGGNLYPNFSQEVKATLTDSLLVA